METDFEFISARMLYTVFRLLQGVLDKENEE
jgi:hypothetical protein